MNIKYLFLLSCTFFSLNMQQNSSWVGHSKKRFYEIEIVNDSIFIKINNSKHSYHLVKDKKKKIFKIECEWYYLSIVEDKLFINYLHLKDRIAINEIASMTFMRDTRHGNK